MRIHQIKALITTWSLLKVALWVMMNIEWARIVLSIVIFREALNEKVRSNKRNFHRLSSFVINHFVTKLIHFSVWDIIRINVQHGDGEGGEMKSCRFPSNYRVLILFFSLPIRLSVHSSHNGSCQTNFHPLSNVLRKRRRVFFNSRDWKLRRQLNDFEWWISLMEKRIW